MIKLSLSGAWQMRDLQSGQWLPATVPGGTYTDLLAAGQIPDPFLGENEKKVQWVADRDWEYCHEFDVAPELLQEDRIELVCEGLDTLAEITLNGQPVGRTSNMFRTYRWEVKEWLSAGINTLAIVFRSPVACVKARQKARRLPAVMNPGMSYLRKVQSHFGWDWGPRLPTSGIWRVSITKGAGRPCSMPHGVSMHPWPSPWRTKAAGSVSLWRMIIRIPGRGPGAGHSKR